MTTCSGWPREFLAKIGILRRDADGASVQVAFAHHDAAHRDQRRRRESEFFRTEQRGNGHVAPGLQFAVNLQLHAAAQIVQHQHLLRFGKSQFPGNACVANRTDRRRARSAVVPADQDHVGMRFRYARSNGADARLGDQLHGNSRARIRILQVVNQLGNILDGINVVVRRR